MVQEESAEEGAEERGEESEERVDVEFGAGGGLFAGRGWGGGGGVGGKGGAAGGGVWAGGRGAGGGIFVFFEDGGGGVAGEEVGGWWGAFFWVLVFLDDGDGLRGVVPVPVCSSESGSQNCEFQFTTKGQTYQGNLTLQFNNTAANPSNVTSVTTAPPPSNTSPPIAGNSANANGTECQCEAPSSCAVTTSGDFARGRKRSSVVDLMDCEASFTESEKVEVREAVRRRGESVEMEKVEARGGGRWRRGERLGREVEVEVVRAVVGLVVRSRSM